MFDLTYSSLAHSTLRQPTDSEEILVTIAFISPYTCRINTPLIEASPNVNEIKHLAPKRWTLLVRRWTPVAIVFLPEPDCLSRLGQSADEISVDDLLSPLDRMAGDRRYLQHGAARFGQINHGGSP